MMKLMELNDNMIPTYKVELHVHLDGAVRLSTVWELAQKKGMELEAKTLEELRERCRIECPSTLKDFLKPFEYYTPVIAGDAEAIERIAYEFCEDAANQRVLYCEVRYSPHLMMSDCMTPREVVICVNRGLARGSARFKITVRSILCCIRGHPEWSDAVLDLCVEFRDRGVVGIDVAGDEALCVAAPNDVQIFRRAAALGIHRTVHAGEAGPAKNVLVALEEMLAERIGHGYHVLDDPDVYERARHSGAHFEGCPHSSCLTGSVPQRCEKHPIIRFAEDEVNFSISRDDPTLIQKTLDEEYRFLKECGLTTRHLVMANLNAAESSFLPEDEKRVLLRRIREIYSSQTDPDRPQELHIPPRGSP